MGSFLVFSDPERSSEHQGFVCMPIALEDGKTYTTAVFASGFCCTPCSMLQTEREFQQQGLHFIHCSLMLFNEFKREQGIVEDGVKLFSGGGRMVFARQS